MAMKTKDFEFSNSCQRFLYALVYLFHHEETLNINLSIKALNASIILSAVHW